MKDEIAFTPFYLSFLEQCKRCGISPTEAAKKAGISSGAPTAWKKKGAIPRPGQLKKLCKLFEVRENELLGYSEKKEKPLINNDEELTEYLEQLKTRPEMRMLFSLTKGATKEDVERAVRIVEAALGK